MAPEPEGRLEDRLLTVAEAADASNCSAKTIYRAIWSDQLKAVKVGSHRRICFSDLVAYWHRDEPDDAT